MNDLDMIIAEALGSTFAHILAHSWRGDEKEAASLFAFGHLVKHCRTDSVLHDPAQVGIGVWLPCPEGISAEKESYKDLVIWPETALTRRSKGRHAAPPLAVMEWKVSQTGTTAYDLAWLRAYSDGNPVCVGYAVWLSLAEEANGLRCDRVHKHSIQPAWFSLSSPAPD